METTQLKGRSCNFSCGWRASISYVLFRPTLFRLAPLRLTFDTKTPEKPDYAAGPWIVQGMANERIVACAAYFSDCDNVTDSELEFRVPVSLGSSVRELNDAEGIKMTWGLEE